MKGKPISTIALMHYWEWETELARKKREMSKDKQIEEMAIGNKARDMVEVVRCKDCKYYEIHKPHITLNCERQGKLIPMMPNDYCSYGERKEK